ncbi:MAG: hypothetical protein ACRC17_10075, partial [Culicoidibacterales bacterium]
MHALNLFTSAINAFFQTIMNVLMNFNDFLWGGVLTLTDESVLSSFLDIREVQTFMTMALTLGVSIVVFTVIMQGYKTLVYSENLQFTLLWKNMIVSILFLVATTFLIQEVAIPISTNLTQAIVHVISPNPGDMEISLTIAANAFANETADPEKFLPIIKEQLKNDEFDSGLECKDVEGICPVGSERIQKVYSTGTFVVNTFLFFGLMIVTTLIGIQIVGRILELALLQVVAPLCASSWISDPNATRARVWIKLTIGATVGTAAQFLVLGIGTLVINNLNDYLSVSGATYFYAYILIVLGVFVAMLMSPAVINQLVDSKSSVLESMQDLMTAKGVATGVGSVAKAGAGIVGGVAKAGAGLANRATGGVLGNVATNSVNAAKSMGVGAMQKASSGLHAMSQGMNGQGGHGTPEQSKSGMGGVNPTMNGQENGKGVMAGINPQANSQVKSGIGGVNPAMSNPTNTSGTTASVNGTKATGATGVNPTMSNPTNTSGTTASVNGTKATGATGVNPAMSNPTNTSGTTASVNGTKATGATGVNPAMSNPTNTSGTTASVNGT